MLAQKKDKNAHGLLGRGTQNPEVASVNWSKESESDGHKKKTEYPTSSEWKGSKRQASEGVSFLQRKKAVEKVPQRVSEERAKYKTQNSEGGGGPYPGSESLPSRIIRLRRAAKSGGKRCFGTRIEWNMKHAGREKREASGGLTPKVHNPGGKKGCTTLPETGEKTGKNQEIFGRHSVTGTKKKNVKTRPVEVPPGRRNGIWVRVTDHCRSRYFPGGCREEGEKEGWEQAPPPKGSLGKAR